jgi:ABC-type nickel/cobalt efflux system permease component RcnA
MKRGRLLLVLACAIRLIAHPMGNFSVSHYARLAPGSDGLTIRYVLDLAEIPTFELLQKWNLEAISPRAALERAASQQARDWTRNLVITSNGRAVVPRLASTELVMAEGAGGMPVMRVAMNLQLPVTAGKIEYEDRNYTERAGWKEIVIAAQGKAAVQNASQGERDRSQALTAYPQDPTVAPPQDLRASLEWTVAPREVAQQPAAPPAQEQTQAVSTVPRQPAASGTVVRGDYLSRLLSNREIGWGMALAGLAVAFGLGAVHALSPGHGKTIVAAYLVGTRGTAKHALFLGAMVTFTHTISVFFLGFVTLFLSHYVLPEKIFPVLGAISGLSIVWIGATLLYKRASGLRAHSHDHDHVHSHDHDHALGHDHNHHHGPGGHTHVPEGDVTLASLIALGASGGLVPCPSALVLLLSSVAMGRVGLGMVLLVGFSAGLAVVLMAIGLMVLYAKHLLPDQERAARHPAFRLIPVLSAALIVCVGLIMTGVSLGIIRPDQVLGLS